MNFKELKIQEDILKALMKLHYEHAMPIQERVIPAVLAGRDVIVKSKTGSGKTAAYAIPLIQQMLWEENKPQGLILVPTRELAVQVQEECSAIGTYRRIKTLAVFGKQPLKRQALDLKQKNHMVVGTPGRILDHVRRGTLDVSCIRFVVLDEADEMLNMGFIEDVETILSYLPDQVQMSLFSATLPQKIQELAQHYVKDAVAVEIAAASDVNDQIEHYGYVCKEHEKKQLLCKLLACENPASCIIFAKTQEHVDEICDMLYEFGVSIDKLHGGMLQDDRLENIKDFKKGKLRFLVATDVASRGIDIEGVTHVINYDFPLEKESYVHRIGRTARKYNTGKAISFMSQFDDQRVKAVEDDIGYEIVKREASELMNIEMTDIRKQQLCKSAALKKDKTEELKKDTMCLYVNGGKKKKLRAGDFVGAICEIAGVQGSDIGPIQILDQVSYIQILNNKGAIVLKELKKKTIKGKTLRVEIAKKP